MSLRRSQGADARSCSRCHELGADGVGDRLSQNAIDLDLRGSVERPPEDLVDGLQLPGMTCTPQCRRCTLIKDPAHGQVDHPLGVAFHGELIETPDRNEILGIERRSEFRVCQSKIVALKLRVRVRFAGQQTATQRSVGQGGEIRFPAIGQELGLDLALEQIIGRLHDVQLGDAAKSFDRATEKLLTPIARIFPSSRSVRIVSAVSSIGTSGSGQ